MENELQDNGAALPGRALDIMRTIKENNGFICTGSCKQIKKGQLHCRNLGSMLGIGPSRIWEIIKVLTDLGLLESLTDNRPITIILTTKGEQLVAQSA